MTVRGLWLVGLWLVATSVAQAQPAQDAPKRRMVAILDIRVDGVSEAIRAQFERDLEEQLDTNAYWLASRSQVADRMKMSTKWTEGCLLGECLTELRIQTNADLVVLAALTGAGTSFGYVVTVVRTDTGQVLSQESSRCDVCTAKETTREAVLSTMKLLNAVPDKLPDEAGERGAQIDIAVGKLVRKMQADERRVSRRGLTMLVTGLVLAAGGAVTFALADRNPYALGVAGLGGGLAVGGGLVMSF